MWNIAQVNPKFSAPTNLGDALMQGLSNAQTLQRQKLANKEAQTNLQTLAQMNQARINAINEGIAVDAARKRMMDLEAQYYPNQFAPHPMSPVGKAQQDYDMAVKAYGEDSPQAKVLKDYMNKLSLPTQGLQLSQTPGGGLAISYGGQAPVDRVPGYGTKTGSGQLFYNPQTGQYQMTPTTQTESKLQQSLVAENNLQDLIKKVI